MELDAVDGKHRDFLDFKNKRKPQSKLREVITESGLESKPVFSLCKTPKGLKCSDKRLLQMTTRHFNWVLFCLSHLPFVCRWWNMVCLRSTIRLKFIFSS